MDTIQQPAFRKQLPSLTRSQLDALEQQQAEGEFSVAFDSSTSGPESSTQSIHDNVSHMEQRFGLGIDMNEKPLPDIPSDVQPSGNTLSDLSVTEYVQCGTGRESLDTSPQLGFSFKPGDDVDILAQNKGRDAHTRNTLGVRTYQRGPTTSKEQSEVSNTSSPSLEGARRRKSIPLSSKPKPQSKPGPARDIQDSETLKRDDSTSSIITAVRDNSGHNSSRSSIDSSRHSSQGIRQRLNRSSGSSEAITAAVRALAGGPATTRSPAPRKNGSSSGTREGGSRGEGNPKEGGEGSKKQSRKTSSIISEVSSTVSSLEDSLKQDKKPTKG